MSDSGDRGKFFENKVASMMRKKLNISVYRDRRSGAGTNKADIVDWFQETPLHLELKDQETIKVKEWFRQAEQAASFHQIPTLVFAMDEEILATLRFSDILDMLLEIAQYKAEIEDLRKPIDIVVPKPVPDLNKMAAEVARHDAERLTSQVVENKIERGVKTCREGHISDEYGYCMQLKCKYSRGYKAPKAKKS